MGFTNEGPKDSEDSDNTIVHTKFGNNMEGPLHKVRHICPIDMGIHKSEPEDYCGESCTDGAAILRIVAGIVVCLAASPAHKATAFKR